MRRRASSLSARKTRRPASVLPCPEYGGRRAGQPGRPGGTAKGGKSWAQTDATLRSTIRRHRRNPLIMLCDPPSSYGWNFGARPEQTRRAAWARQEPLSRPVCCWHAGAEHRKKRGPFRKPALSGALDHPRRIARARALCGFELVGRRRHCAEQAKARCRIVTLRRSQPGHRPDVLSSRRTARHPVGRDVLIQPVVGSPRRPSAGGRPLNVAMTFALLRRCEDERRCAIGAIPRASSAAAVHQI